MAKRQTIVLVDDFDGSEASVSIDFSFEGVNYTIDLTEEHAKEMRETFAKYTEVAQKSRRRGGSRRSGGGSGLSREKLQAIREWATNNGYKVAPRGRIKQEIISAYEAAN